MKKPRRENRIFLAALGISALLHLSMVTVFSIGVYFPRTDLRYYSFDIVDYRTRQKVFAMRDGRLRLPSVEAGADSAQQLGAGEPLSILPQIDLPVVEFAELERLRVQRQGTELSDRFQSLLQQDEPIDTWARFAGELGQLGGALSRLGLFDREQRENSGTASPITRPAPGFEAYIEWMSGPKSRDLLFAPGIQALWDVDAVNFEPVWVIFEVNPAGEVTEVLTPVEDEAGIVTEVGAALLSFRFAPLESGGGNQRGMLQIQAEQERL